MTMPTTDQAQSRRRARRVVHHLRFPALVGAAVLYVAGARTAAAVVAVATVVITLALDWWLGRGLVSERQVAFEQWAADRGLRLDPEPVENRYRFTLLRRTGLQIHRAVSQQVHGGRLALMEWSYSTSDGHRARHSGLLIHTAPTASEIMMKPTTRWRLPRVPGSYPDRESGHPALDQAFAMSGPDEPRWVDAAIAEALIPFAARRATVEVSDDVVVIEGPVVAPQEWDAMLAEGLALAEALGSRSTQ